MSESRLKDHKTVDNPTKYLKTAKNVKEPSKNHENCEMADKNVKKP